MKHIDEIYKDWCGESHIANSCHPVHDSAEAQDFAQYYHGEIMAEAGAKSDQQPGVSQSGGAGSKGGPKNAEGLLPCPFCGKEAEILDNSANALVYIQCRRCTAEANGIDRDDAILKWNTRGGERF